MKPRNETEQPFAIQKLGWRYHHLGIPTTEQRPNERYIPHLKMAVSGFPSSEFGIEWMRFEPDSPVHPLIQHVPHLAFVVDDLETALRERILLSPPSEPMHGIRVAMIEENGAPIELLEFGGSNAPQGR